MSETPSRAPREPIRIVVDYDISRLRPNLRLHWAERHRRTKDAQAAAVLAYRAAGSPTSTVPVRISFTLYRARKMDDDGCVSGCKALRDRICCASRFGGEGVVPDDGPAWVSLGEVRQVTGKEWRGREQVEVLIVPREEEGGP